MSKPATVGTHVVPVAYITKYAETRGIIVVRGARTSETGEYLVAKPMFISPKDWTEDLAKAQFRHEANLRRLLHLALKRVAKIQKMLTEKAPLEDKP